MRLGHDRFDPDLGAWASEFRMSESNHRQFSRRWADLMTPVDWHELAGAPAREKQYA